jgi:hypothetical protein
MKSVLAFSLDKIQLGNTTETLGGKYSNGGIGFFISIILKYSLMLAGIILLALLLFGGLTFIINAGKADPKKAGQGQKAITSALIGFAIVFLSYSIIKIIGIITGFDILNSGL